MVFDTPKEIDSFKLLCFSKEVAFPQSPAWLWMKLKQNKGEESKKCRFKKMCLSVKEYLFKTGDISIGKHI